jgi:hypothetical protein
MGSCSSSGGECTSCAPAFSLVGVSADASIPDFGEECEGKRYAISTDRMTGGYYIHAWYGSTYNGGYYSNSTFTLHYGIDKYGNFYALTSVNGSTTLIQSFTIVSEEDSYTLNYDGSSVTEENFVEKDCGPYIENNSSCSTSSDWALIDSLSCPCTGPYFPANDCPPWGALQSSSSSCTNSTSTWSSYNLINPYGNPGYYELSTANTQQTSTRSKEIKVEEKNGLRKKQVDIQMDILQNNQPQDCLDTRCGAQPYEKYGCWGVVGSFTPVASPSVKKLKLGVVANKKLLEKYKSIGGSIKVFIPAPWDEESGDPEPNNCPCSTEFEGQMLKSIGFSMSSSAKHYSGSGDEEQVIAESSELNSSQFQSHLEALSLGICINSVVLMDS